MSGLLLVEARRPQGLGETNAEPFPFILGFLEGRGEPAAWLAFSHESWAPGGDPYRLDLRAPARAALVARARALGASHLLFSETPSAALRRALARALPGVALGHCASRADHYDAARLTRWLGLPRAEGFLPDLAAPSYRAQAAGPAGAAPATPIVGSTHCLYAAPLGSNPAFRGVDLSGIGRKFACSFCPGPSDLKYPFRTPPIELALRQIRGVQAEARAVWSPTEFVVRSAALFMSMSKLLARLEAERTPPLALYFSCRADEALARARDIEAALATARRCGHTIHVYSMGVENFSPAENERLNKGLAFEDVRAALELLRGWEKGYPDTFFFTRHGGLGFILFTPWTTLADLEANLEAARSLGLSEDAFLLSRRLMLFDDMPITRLAERDGLVDPSEPEARRLFGLLQAHCDPGCRHFDSERDRPWRFRDPLAARVCAVAVRLASRAVDGKDPYHGRLRAAVEASGVRELDAFRLLVKLAGKRAEASVPALCEELLSLLSRLGAGYTPNTPK